MSTQKDEHFMKKHEGPVKQYMALVGDDNGAIKDELDNLNQSARNAGKNCYYIDNYYYSSKYGLKKFKAFSMIIKEIQENNTLMPCLLVVYKSLRELLGVEKIAELMKADARVIIIESIDKCKEHQKVEDFAAENNFEVVYMSPNEEQLKDAEENSELTGMKRLVEIIEVCNWPWRVVNDLDNVQRNKAEQRVNFMMSSDAAGLLLNNFREWVFMKPEYQDIIPEPQHAERVHLSPDSPTTTEGTTKDEDVNVSVDIDLVCENKEKNTQNTEKAPPTPEKKNKQKVQ